MEDLTKIRSDSLKHFSVFWILGHLMFWRLRTSDRVSFPANIVCYIDSFTLLLTITGNHPDQ